MSWNRRVMVRINGEYAIVEVYYGEDDHIEGWTVENMTPWGVGLEELRWSLEDMLKALDKPVLEEGELEAEMLENRVGDFPEQNWRRWK